MTLTGVAKCKGKLTCGFKNDIRNLVNFHASSQKCGKKICTSIGFFCPKHTKV